MDKRYIIVSIVHSENQNNGWYLWGHNSSGYVGTPDLAGLYAEDDHPDYPVVKMRKDLVKHYAKYNSVKVLKSEFELFMQNKASTVNYSCEEELRMKIRELETDIKRRDKALQLAKDELTGIQTLTSELCALHPDCGTYNPQKVFIKIEAALKGKYDE